MSRDLGSARPLVWSDPGRTTAEIKTGGWRTRRPRYVDRPAPCHLACPAGEPIPAWIARAQAGDFQSAWELIRQENPFPAITGRVCSHPCEAACNRGPYDSAVAVNALERFVGDWGLAHGNPAPPLAGREERVAIVGGGPAGLACAYHLARLGYRVTVYEAMPELGGLLRYGIPEYRLPRTVLNPEIARVLDLGVVARTRTRIGETTPWDALDAYQAVFLATGAACPVRLGIRGEVSRGVWDGLAFLREVNSGRRPTLGRRVVVVGGGSTAMDVARAAIRLGASVTVLALEAREAMPAVADEVEEALAEGVTIMNQLGVEEILGRKGGVAAVRARPARISVTESGAIQPVLSEGSPVVLEADALLLGVGQLPDLALLPPGLTIKHGLVVVGEDGATGDPRLFAGGDLTRGPRSVAHAVGAGTRAARAIHRFLSGVSLSPLTLPSPPLGERMKGEGEGDVVTFAEIGLHCFPRAERAEPGKRGPAARAASFVEVVHGLGEARACAEARRCFSCGACTRCDRCLVFCPDVAIRRVDGAGYEVLADFCKGCGLCARECPRGALVMVPEMS